jgi:hypothetical protein
MYIAIAIFRTAATDARLGSESHGKKADKETTDT